MAKPIVRKDVKHLTKAIHSMGSKGHAALRNQCLNMGTYILAHKQFTDSAQSNHYYFGTEAERSKARTAWIRYLSLIGRPLDPHGMVGNSASFDLWRLVNTQDGDTVLTDHEKEILYGPERINPVL